MFHFLKVTAGLKLWVIIQTRTQLITRGRLLIIKVQNILKAIYFRFALLVIWELQSEYSTIPSTSVASVFNFNTDIANIIGWQSLLYYKKNQSIDEKSIFMKAFDTATLCLNHVFI